MDRISVIIPTYNRENTIERAIRSVLCQTYDNLEVIVADDGSIDSTEEVVRGIEDSRVKYFRLPKNGGAGYARNEGVKLASSELIAFHDSDDAWRPEKLERQIKYWEKHPEYSMVYCALFACRYNGATVRMPRDDMEGELQGGIFNSLLERNSIGTPTMLMRKECFWDCGGFDESLKCLEDWEFALRFSRKYLIGYLDEILVDVYDGGRSVSLEAGGYYETRCRIIADYRTELIRAGIFDKVVGKLFEIAEEGGVLGQVKNLLLLMLQKNV